MGGKKDELWREAARKCRLDTADIALAKRLGLNPLSLIKNIPGKSEPWKAPVKEWLHAIDLKRRKKSEEKQKRKENLRISADGAEPGSWRAQEGEKRG